MEQALGQSDGLTRTLEKAASPLRNALKAVSGAGSRPVVDARVLTTRRQEQCALSASDAVVAETDSFDVPRGEPVAHFNQCGPRTSQFRNTLQIDPRRLPGLVGTRAVTDPGALQLESRRTGRPPALANGSVLEARHPHRCSGNFHRPIGGRALTPDTRSPRSIVLAGRRLRTSLYDRSSPTGDRETRHRRSSGNRTEDCSDHYRPCRGSRSR